MKLATTKWDQPVDPQPSWEIPSVRISKNGEVGRSLELLITGFSFHVNKRKVLAYSTPPHVF